MQLQLGVFEGGGGEQVKPSKFCYYNFCFLTEYDV